MLPRCNAGRAFYKSSEWRGRSPAIRYEPKLAPVQASVVTIRGERHLSVIERDAQWSETGVGAATALVREDGPPQLDKDLQELRTLEANWDGQASAVPSRQVIEKVERALGLLFAIGARPAAIRPSTEGGAGICWATENGYGHIEFMNDDEIYGLAYSTGREPESWQLRDLSETSLRESFDRIRAHL